MERLNEEFRDREKVMRGVKKMDSNFDGSQIYHNYVRPHIGLDGKDVCPSLWNKDKWKRQMENPYSKCDSQQSKPVTKL